MVVWDTSGSEIRVAYNITVKAGETKVLTGFALFDQRVSLVRQLLYFAHNRVTALFTHAVGASATGVCCLAHTGQH